MCKWAIPSSKQTKYYYSCPFKAEHKTYHCQVEIMRRQSSQNMRMTSHLRHDLPSFLVGNNPSLQFDGRVMNVKLGDSSNFTHKPGSRYEIRMNILSNQSLWRGRGRWVSSIVRWQVINSLAFFNLPTRIQCCQKCIGLPKRQRLSALTVGIAFGSRAPGKRIRPFLLVQNTSCCMIVVSSIFEHCVRIGRRDARWRGCYRLGATRCVQWNASLWLEIDESCW